MVKFQLIFDLLPVDFWLIWANLVKFQLFFIVFELIFDQFFINFHSFLVKFYSIFQCFKYKSFRFKNGLTLKHYNKRLSKGSRPRDWSLQHRKVWCMRKHTWCQLKCYQVIIGGKCQHLAYHWTDILQALVVNNNKLVSLPEEIGKMQTLMELDASCNEITHLPVQIGDLAALKVLNLRRNHLQEIPIGDTSLLIWRL